MEYTLKILNTVIGCIGFIKRFEEKLTLLELGITNLLTMQESKKKCWKPVALVALIGESLCVKCNGKKKCLYPSFVYYKLFFFSFLLIGRRSVPKLYDVRALS